LRKILSGRQKRGFYTKSEFGNFLEKLYTVFMKIIKVFHLFFVILWTGALTLLPLLLREKIKKSYQWYLTYQLPCMVLTVTTGVVLLLAKLEKLKQGNFHLKLTCVLVLIACDLWLGRQAKLLVKKEKSVGERVLWAVQIAIFFFLFTTLYAIFAWQK
jgi:uncharacterized membrane protein